MNNEELQNRSSRAAIYQHQAAAANAAAAAVNNPAAAAAAAAATDMSNAMDYANAHPHAHATNPFDLESFEMSGTGPPPAAASGQFTDMELTRASSGGGGYSAGAEPGMLAGQNNNPSAGSPMAPPSSSPTATAAACTPSACKKERVSGGGGGGSYPQPPQINDYSPEWAWTEVRSIFNISINGQFSTFQKNGVCFYVIPFYFDRRVTFLWGVSLLFLTKLSLVRKL